MKNSKSNPMCCLDYARDIVNAVDGLKHIYKEDFPLVVKSLGIDIKKLEVLEISEKQYMELMIYFRNEKNPVLWANNPENWIDGYFFDEVPHELIQRN